MNTRTAAQRLRDANPVVPGEFDGAAAGPAGRALLQDILASPAAGGARTRRPRFGTGAPVPPGRGIRARRLAVPAVAAAAAIATGAVMILHGVGAPRAKAAPYQLDTFVTVVPAANPGDAAAVLRRLARSAARQPEPALGPVEYTSYTHWQPMGLKVPLNLGYVPRVHYLTQYWMRLAGGWAQLDTKYPRGTKYGSRFPSIATNRRYFRWYNPATLPTGDAALRQRMMNPPWPHNTGRLLQEPGLPSAQQDLVGTILRVMEVEPLPPGVRAAMFRLLAGVAVSPGRGYRILDMGTATDRLGRIGVAIALEDANTWGGGLQDVEILIFDPRTGALLDRTGGNCTIKLGSIPRQRGDCMPGDYDQYNVIKAVPRLPSFPANLRHLFPGHQ